MYIDGIIVFSLVTIALIVWMMVYIGLYSYRHIKEDTEKAQKQCQDCEVCTNNNNNKKHPIERLA